MWLFFVAIVLISGLGTPSAFAQIWQTNDPTANNVALFGEGYGLPSVFNFSYQDFFHGTPFAHPIEARKTDVRSEDARILIEMKLYDFHHSGRNELMTHLYGSLLEEEATRHHLIGRFGEQYIFAPDPKVSPSEYSEEYNDESISPKVAMSLLNILYQAMQEKKAALRVQRATQDTWPKEKKELIHNFYVSLTQETKNIENDLREENLSWSGFFKIFAKIRKECQLYKDFQRSAVEKSSLDHLREACDVDVEHREDFKDCFYNPFLLTPPGVHSEDDLAYHSTFSDLTTSFNQLASEKWQTQTVANKTELHNFITDLIDDIDRADQDEQFVDKTSFMDHLTTYGLPREGLEAVVEFGRLKDPSQNNYLEEIERAQNQIAAEFNLVKREYPFQTDLQKNVLTYYQGLQSCAQGFRSREDSRNIDDEAYSIVKSFEESVARVDGNSVPPDTFNKSITLPEAYIDFRKDLRAPMSKKAINRLMLQRALYEADGVISDLENSDVGLTDIPQSRKAMSRYGGELMNHFDQLEEYWEKIFNLHAQITKNYQETGNSPNELEDTLQNNVTEIESLFKDVALKIRKDMAEDYLPYQGKPQSRAFSISRTIKNDGTISARIRYELPGLDATNSSATIAHEYRELEVLRKREAQSIYYWENGTPKKLPNEVNSDDISSIPTTIGGTTFSNAK